MSTLQTLGTDVRRTRPEDAPTISAVLTAAFDDDPVFRWLTPDDENRAAVNRAFFDLVVDALAPHDDCWTDGDASGAALWVPYGRDAMSQERGELLEAQMAELYHPYADRVEQLGAAMDAAHPAEPHEYLWFLGVTPAMQGRGIGSRLLAPVLQRADRNRHPAYLEATSPRNRDLYARHGFVAAAPIAAPGGPPLWPMWRPAA